MEEQGPASSPLSMPGLAPPQGLLLSVVCTSALAVRHGAPKDQGLAIVLAAEEDPSIPLERRFAMTRPSVRLEGIMDNPQAREIMATGKHFTLELRPAQEP